MRRPTRAERRQIKNCRVFEDARLNSEDFGFRQNQIGSVDGEAVLRSRPRNDVSWLGGDPWIAPSEFELIKNRVTIALPAPTPPGARASPRPLALYRGALS